MIDGLNGNKNNENINSINKNKDLMNRINFSNEKRKLTIKIKK